MHQLIGVWCLGPPRLTIGGELVSLRSKDQRALIASLVAAGPKGLTKDELYHELFDWSEATKSEAQAAVMRVQRLRTKITRKLPEAKGAITTGPRYAFDPTLCFVDIWAFDEAANGTGFTDLAQAMELWTGKPYEAIDDYQPSLAGDADRLHERWIEVAARLAWQITPDQGAAHLSDVIAASDASPTNEALAAGAAAALYRFGRQTEALDLAQRRTQLLMDRHGLSPGSALRRIEQAILKHDSDALAVRLERESTSTVRVEPIPDEVREQPRRYVGRQQNVSVITELIAEHTGDQSDRLSGHMVFVSGEAGAGKSTLVSKVLAAPEVKRLELRYSGSRSIDSNNEDSPYGPFLRALPELNSELAKVHGSGGGHDRRVSYWNGVENCLARVAAERPTLVIIDDLHAADSQSALLVRHLASIDLPRNLVVLLTARPPAPDVSIWTGTYDSLIHEGQVTHIDLAPLTSADLHALVRLDHPTEPPMRQTIFADRLLDLSQGNALVASVLSRDAPRGLDTSLLPESVTPSEGFANHLRAKVTDPELEELLSVAALIGLRFDPALLADIVGQSTERVLELLQTAERLSLCRPDSNGWWSFDHLLTVNFFTTRLKLLRPILFARLAQHPRAPQDSMVRYIQGARYELPPAFVLPALLSAAEALGRDLAFTEATTALEHAVEIMDGDDPRRYDALLTLATSTARSGANGQAKKWRQSAFDLAKRQGDVDRMCRSAIAGLPESEFAGGEPDRLEMLAQIDPGQQTMLSPAEFARVHLRQARVCEDHTLLRSIVEQSDQEWQKSDPAGWDAMMFEWWMFQATAGNGRAIFDDLKALTERLKPGPLRAEVYHRLLVAALVEQRPDAATSVFDRAAREINSSGSPRTRWSLDVAAASLSAVGLRPGSTIEAARLSGLRWGIPDAFDNWAVQLWVESWLAGRHDETLRLISANRSAISPNVAWSAGEALGCAHAGDWEQAEGLADYVSTEIKAKPDGLWVQVAAALLIEAAKVADLPSAARAGTDALTPHSGRAILLGIGAAHFGPVDRYLSIAAGITGDADPAALMSAAHAQSELCGSAYWLERTREHSDQSSTSPAP